VAALQCDYAGFVLNNIAPAMSSTRKIGSNTGGTSHSRILNEDDFDIGRLWLRREHRRSQSPIVARGTR